jgi:hypothetical protein
MPHSLDSALAAQCAKFNILFEKKPTDDLYYICGNVHFLFVPLPPVTNDAPEKFRETVLKAAEIVIKRALDTRKSLPSAAANDLNLVFTAEPQAENKSLWKDLQHEIERDDRVCRKLVWLKGKHGIGADEFLKRTSLARPWEDASQSTSDALRLLFDGVGIDAGKVVDILLEEDLEGEELVRALMKHVGGELG